MVEHAEAGEGPRLGMLVLHDDADREYAYGEPRHQGRHVYPELYDEAMNDGWMVISMKKDWGKDLRPAAIARRQMIAEKVADTIRTGEIPERRGIL